jgi:uncharacterized membrane protein
MGKNSGHIKWLYKELPGLVSESILSSEAADKIRAKYGEPGGFKPLAVVGAALGAGGALLAGLGVIALFAHNWDSFPRAVKLLVSFAPLLASVLFGFWVLIGKRDSAPFREAAAILNALTCAACLGIVSQVYHHGGSLRDFLTVCLLLSFALIYIFDSLAMLMMYIAALVVWTFSGPSGLDGFMFFERSKIFQILSLLGFGALAAPRVAGLFSRKPDSPGAAALAAELFIVSLFILPFWTERLAFSALVLFFSSVSVFSRMTRAPEAKVWTFLRAASAVTVLFIMCLLSFGWNWGYHNFWLCYFQSSVASSVALAVFLLYLSSVFFAAFGNRRGLAGPPELAGAAVFLAAVITEWAPGLSVLFVNLFLAGAAVFYVWRGWRDASLLRVNTGLVLGAALIFMRFFDSNVSLLVKGVAFIICGAALTFVNLRLVSKLKGGSK